MQTARLCERTSFLGQVAIVPHVGARSLSAWGQDVSESGMFLQTTQAFAVGDALSLRFSVDGIDVHVRAAEVMWVRKFEPINIDGKLPGIGIRFVSVDPPARAALRRLVHSDVEAAPPATPVKAAFDSVLPLPTMTLPPLSRSIIESAGGRDLDDTQDLLPPPAARRTPPKTSSDGMNFSMLPFTSLDVSLPPDDPNLSPESRVFAGVPVAPRPVTMLPRPRSVAPITAPIPSIMSMPPAPPSTVPQTPLTSARMPSVSAPPVKVTQPLFTLPPISVVERFDPTQAPVMAVNDADPPADDDAVAGLPILTTDAATDAFAGWSFKLAEPLSAAPVAANDDSDDSDDCDDGDNDNEDEFRHAGALDDDADVDAFVRAALHQRFDDDGPIIENPSILEAITLPPSRCVDASERPAANDNDDSFSMGPVPTSTSEPPRVMAEATMSIRHLPLEERRPTRHTALTSPRRSRSLGVAAAVLVAGCAAGAVIGVTQWNGDVSASLAATTAAPTAPTTTSAVSNIARADVAAALPVAKAPQSVADAEAELTAPPKAVAAAKTTPAPVAGVAPKVADRAAAPKAEPMLTSSTPATPARSGLTLPGRLEVKVPEAGRLSRVFALGSPARVVIDLEGATLPTASKTVDHGGALQVRFGRPTTGRERIVIVLAGDDKPTAVDARLDGDTIVASWQF